MPLVEPAFIATSTAKFAISKLVELGKRNDEILKHERVELALAWGAELKATVPEAIRYLGTRVDNLDARLAQVFEDHQFGRVYRNLEFEALREALDERRRMLAHAGAGLLNPDIPIERKARVERTLRALDPLDVRTLLGLHLLPGGTDSNGLRASLLFKAPSGDVLVAAGCVRLAVIGGGFGSGAGQAASVTQIGKDVLASLRTYLATRPPPFEVPGREYLPSDRSEQVARQELYSIEGLRELLPRLSRREDIPTRWGTYRRPSKSNAEPLLTFYLHDWRSDYPQFKKVADACAGREIRIELPLQQYKPEEGEPYDILRLEFDGPHDLLRHLADDCEAAWL